MCGQGILMSWLKSVYIWTWQGGPALGDCHQHPETPTGSYDEEAFSAETAKGM